MNPIIISSQFQLQLQRQGQRPYALSAPTLQPYVPTSQILQHPTLIRQYLSPIRQPYAQSAQVPVPVPVPVPATAPAPAPVPAPMPVPAPKTDNSWCNTNVTNISDTNFKILLVCFIISIAINGFSIYYMNTLSEEKKKKKNDIAISMNHFCDSYGISLSFFIIISYFFFCSKFNIINKFLLTWQFINCIMNVCLLIYIAS